MKEEERIEIVNRIQKDIKEKESLDTKYKKLEKLSRNPIVAKYLQLVEDINRIEKDVERYRNPINGLMEDSLAERIKRTFRWSVDSHSCNHSVWFYAGSYYKFTNFKYEEDYTMKDSENLSNSLETFWYNVYWCLECNKKIKISRFDWESFEKKHIVLKKQPVNLSEIESYYIPLYYHLLYHNYDFADAEQIVIDEFNSGNKKDIKDILVRRRKK